MVENYCIELKHTICIEPNCGKYSRGKNDKCRKHYGGERCVETGCGKYSRGKNGKCKKHGGGIRCIEQDCKVGARDGFDKCTKHGGGKRCDEQDCNANARDGYNNCKKHGGGTRCAEQDCNANARDGYNNCKKHGGGERCPNCITHIDSRCGSSAYDGYCATCFKRVFPNDERSKKIYTHSKEIMVRNIINANFEGFIHDIPLYTGNCDCTHRRRIDHRKLFGNTILAIETDEFGHRGYDKIDEEIRYDDLFMIHSGKWIFIRFNPDSNISKIDINDKLNKLIETIEVCIDCIKQENNTDLVKIIKLFC